MNTTPGPWEVTTITPETRGFLTTTVQVRGGEYEGTLKDYDGKPIKLYKLVANLQGTEAEHSADGDIMYYRPSDQAMADARLIADCPQLLEACKMALEDLDPYYYIDLPGGYAVMETIDKLRAAIAAAEGGEP